MDSFDGKVLVNSSLPKEMSFERISSIEDFQGSRCVLTDTLNPDIFLIFGKIDLVISKNGSKLSHLAIVAREYGKSVILAEIPKDITEGNLKIDIDGEKANIQIF